MSTDGQWLSIFPKYWGARKYQWTVELYKMIYKKYLQEGDTYSTPETECKQKYKSILTDILLYMPSLHC